MSKYLGLLITLSLFISCSENRESDNPEIVLAENVPTYNTADMVFVTKRGHVEFTSRVFGTIGTFTGESRDLNGKIDLLENTISFSLELSSLKTGIRQRDRDMHRTLDVDRYPVSEYTGVLSSVIDQNSPVMQNVNVEGAFTLHGVTRDLIITGTLRNQPDGLILEVDWPLKLSDFQIEQPRIYGVGIEDEQDIRIRATLVPELIASGL